MALRGGRERRFRSRIAEPLGRQGDRPSFSHLAARVIDSMTTLRVSQQLKPADADWRLTRGTASALPADKVHKASTSDRDGTAPLENPRAVLSSIIDRIQNGPWCFVQLRGAPLSTEDIGRGDVDFLASRSSVDALLSAVFEWTLAGECHAIIRSRSTDKVGLEIFDIDGGDSLCFDFWIELWQLAGGTNYLRFEDVAHLVGASNGIARVPPEIEAAIYLEHLVSKKRKLDNDHVRGRLSNYESTCASAGSAELAAALARIQHSGKIDEQALAVSRKLLADNKLWPAARPSIRLRHKIVTEMRAAWLDAPRKTRSMSIMGCDGSGKTSVIKKLREAEPNKFKSYVGKRLYRNSILYKIAVALIRPLLFQGREKFDDTLAPFNYMRAAAALPFLNLFSGRKLTLVDRALIDFVIVDRKSDHPRLHRASGLSRVFGQRIPVMHLLVPQARLSQRKREMTEAGHARYDRLVFDCLSRRTPTTYVLFHNGGGIETSVAAARNIILQASRT